MDNRLTRKIINLRSIMPVVNKKKLPQPSGYIKSLNPQKYFVIVDVQTTFWRQFDLPVYLERE